MDTITVIGIGTALTMTILGCYLIKQRREIIEKHSQKLEEWERNRERLKELLVSHQNGSAVGTVHNGKAVITESALKHMKELEKQWEKFKEDAEAFKKYSLFFSILGCLSGLIGAFSILEALELFWKIEFPVSDTTLRIVISVFTLMLSYLMVNELPAPGEESEEVACEPSDSDTEIWTGDDFDAGKFYYGAGEYFYNHKK